MKFDTKSFLRMSTASPLSVLRLSSKMHILPSLCIYLTTACNYDCFMCESRKSKESPREHMDITLFSKLVSECVKLRFKPRLHFSGLGEPLVYRDFKEVAKICSEASLPWSVTSNGLALKQYTDALIENGCHGINLSVHGLEKDHDIIVGTKGAFTIVEKAVAQLEKRKNSLKIKKPRIALNCVINNKNVLQLDEICHELSSWPVSSITFQHVSFSKEDVQNNADYMITDKSKLEFLADFVQRIKRTKPVVPVHFFPDLKEEVLKSYHQGHDFGKQYRCFLPWLSLRIYPDGIVKMCEQFLGDLKTETILQIMNGENAKRMRSRLQDNTFSTSACYRCCHRRYK